MICLSPLLVNITPSFTNPRKKIIDFDPQYPIVANDCLPCGRCINCRLNYMHEWGMRCEHEAVMSSSGGNFFNFFITLTYNNENLPLDASLCKKDFTNFVKRVRKHFAGSAKSYIRYFACGEYGTVNGRPHYHVIFFNLPLNDLFYFRNIKGIKYFVSHTIDDLWNKGYSLIGPVNYESAAYVAGYAMKKQKGCCRTYRYINLSNGIISSFRSENRPLTIPLDQYKPKLCEFRRGKVIADLATAYDVHTGEMIFPDLLDDDADAEYDPLDTDFSNIRILEDEFAVMSLKPGIGTEFYNKYKGEMFRNGFMIHQGKPTAIPKCYVRKYYAECSDEEFQIAEAARKKFADSHSSQSSSDLEYLARKLKTVEKRLEMFGSLRYL